MDLVAPVDHHLVGLVRVSTDSQDTQLQRDALVAVGCGRIFEEKVSTRATERPGLAAALDHLRPDAGDNLVVWKRTMAGLAAARRQGRVGGRPSVMDGDKLAAAKARRAAGQSPTQIAKALGISRASVYRHLAAAKPDQP